ncbi:MAG: hypothetical protein RIQ72_336 [Candidatus Parcubacteria bacterium]
MNNIDIEESHDDSVLWDKSLSPSRFRGLVYHKYTLCFVVVLSVIVFVIQLHILGWVTLKKYQRHNQVSFLHMLDIGQGDSFIIDHYTGHRIVIDTGSNSNIFMTQLYQDRCCLINYHKTRKTIDLLLLTHDDADHAAALVGLPSDIKIGTIMTSPFTYSYIEKYMQLKSDQLKLKLKSKSEQKSESEKSKSTILPVTNGFSFNILSDTFEIIFPKNQESVSEQRYQKLGSDKTEKIGSSNYLPTISSRRPENDNSIIMKTTLNNKTILFTGDAGFEAELALFEDGKIKKKIENIDILKVGHHGSKYSSGREFLEIAKPQYALISAGKKNTYGHPHKSVLKRLESAGVKKENIFRTDTCGQIQLTIYKMGAIGHPDCKSISYDNKGLD